MKFKRSCKASMPIAYAVSLTIIEPMNMYTIFFSRMARSQSSCGVATDIRFLKSGVSSFDSMGLREETILS